MLLLKRLLCVALAVLCLLSLCACSGEEAQSTNGQKLDILGMELGQIKNYIEIGKYKGLEVSTDENTRDGAIWAAVEGNFSLKEYPEQHVLYYAEQLRAEYRYYAEQDGKSKDEIDALLEESEKSILAEARALTKSDLVYAAIVKLEGISVTEDEKAALFDRYVEKYVSVYGYGAEYVKQNMADEIYSSMLYDKTTEFLLTNNNVK